MLGRSNKATMPMAAVAAGALLLTGCGVGVTPAAQPQQLTPDASANSGLAAVTLPDGASWLYDVDHSGGTAGDHQAITWDGIDLPNGTGAAVLCDGEMSETVFELDGRFELLSGNIVLGDHAPSDLAVRVYLVLDGADLDARMLYNEDSDAYASYGSGQHADADPGAIDALVAGGQELTVITVLEEGTCIPGDAPYVTFAETYLTGS